MVEGCWGTGWLARRSLGRRRESCWLMERQEAFDRWRSRRGGGLGPCARLCNRPRLGRVFALEADLDGALRQMAGSFEAKGFEGEGIVGANMALLLDKEHLVIGLIGRQVADAAAVQGKTVQRCHAQHRMGLSVVLFLDPGNELAVEPFQ